MESIVRAELTENEAARKSDTALLMGCFERMGIDTSRSFAELAADGSLRQMESITRARRKVQADSPELKDGTVTELRAAREERVQRIRESKIRRTYKWQAKKGLAHRRRSSSTGAE